MILKLFYFLQSQRKVTSITKWSANSCILIRSFNLMIEQAWKYLSREFFIAISKLFRTPLWSCPSWSRQGFSSSLTCRKMGVTNLLGLWKGVWLTSYSGLLMPLTRRAPIIGNSTFFFNGYKRVCYVNRRFKSKDLYRLELYNISITLLLSTIKKINQ